MTNTSRAFLCFLLLSFIPCPAWAATSSVTVLHTTDTHGYIESSPSTIGLDRIAAIRKSIPGAVLLEGGDFLFGSPLALFDQGKTILNLMRQTGYTAAVIGNHEFSQGRDIFEERNREAMEGPAPMPMLSANILGPDGTLLFQPWTRVAVNDVSLCVFGLTTTLTRKLPSSYHAADLTIADPLTTGVAMATRLRASGCDIVLALVHLGSDESQPVTSLTLAEKTPGLDAVIDGHSHKRFSRLEPGTTPVISAGAHGKALGKLVFTVDTETRKITRIESTMLRPKDVAGIVPDATLAQAVRTYRETVDRELSDRIITSPVPLEATASLLRTREMPLGSLAADALRATNNDHIAIINGGSLRASLPAGNITTRNILTAFPFKNTVVSLPVTGAELLDILERGFSKLPRESGGFPQISGFTVVVDASLPQGKRVRSVSVNGTALDKKTVYTLATNDYMAQGGNGYPHLAAKKPLHKEEPFVQAFINYLRQKGSPSFVAGEKRIQILNMPVHPTPPE